VSESDFFVRLRSESGSPIESFFLHRTLKLGIPVKMVQFLLKLLLKQRIRAVYHGFYRLLAATKLLTAKPHSSFVKESELESGVGVGIGVGHFTSDPATLPPISTN